jgi:cytosine/adenosine deaminase-related metal-dependent hydrolase
MLLARLDLALRPPGEAGAGGWMAARDVLEMATLGGARVLGRDDVGSLEPGKCADFFSLDMGALEYAGALHDPVAATLFCAPTRARFTVVHGRVVVEEGRLATVELGPLVERQNRLAGALTGGLPTSAR